MITWNEPGDSYYHHGIDRGALYFPNQPGKGTPAWNGLTGLEENTETGETTLLYRDGVMYYSDVEPADFKGRITAMSYPRALASCLGLPEAEQGFTADNQKPTKFHLTYRSLIGTGEAGDSFGYLLHVLYNVTAVISTVSRKTINENTNPHEFSFDVVCTPVKLAGYRPTAHYIFDTRYVNLNKLRNVENLLYGNSAGSVPYMPDITTLRNAIRS